VADNRTKIVAQTITSGKMQPRPEMNIKLKEWALGPLSVYGPRFVTASPGVAASPGSVFFDFGPPPPPYIISNSFGKLDTFSDSLVTWTLPVRIDFSNAIAFHGDYFYVTDSGYGIGQLNTSTGEFVLWPFPYPFWGRISYHLAFDSNNRIFFGLVINGIDQWIGCLDTASNTFTFWSLGQTTLSWAPDIVLDQAGLVSVCYKWGTYSGISQLDPSSNRVVSWQTPYYVLMSLVVDDHGHLFFGDFNAPCKIARLTPTSNDFWEWDVAFYSGQMARHPSGVLYYLGGISLWQFTPTPHPTSVTKLKPMRTHSHPQVAVVKPTATTWPHTPPVPVSSTPHSVHGISVGAAVTRFPLPSPSSSSGFAIDINRSGQVFFTDSGASQVTYVY
jgi:hypothetical protein